MSLLLAVLPAEGASIAVADANTCETCRCCIQTNTNPAPARNAPATAAKTVRVDREARIEPAPFIFPNFPASEAMLVSLEHTIPVMFPVALFERHCSFLI